MELGAKSLYNALRFRLFEEESAPESSSWKVADFRILTLERLFQDLNTLGNPLDKRAFQAYAEECDSPEELVELLYMHSDEEDPEGADHLYLILFELWRRLVPERPSISILCDELDHAIFGYDVGGDEADAVWKSLEAVLEVVRSNVDQGLPIKEAFQAVELCCAHNLRQFFTDFIFDLLDSSLTQDAQELFERLKPLFDVNPWTLLIQARFAVERSSEEAKVLFRKALALAEKSPLQAEFFAEATQSLRWIEEDSLCPTILDGGWRSIKTCADIVTYLGMLSDFVSIYDLDTFEERVQGLLEEAEADADDTRALASSDKAFGDLRRLMQEILLAQKTRIGVD